MPPVFRPAQAVDHRAEHTGRLADIRAESVPEQAADGDHWLVVVDRHETSLYHTMTKARRIHFATLSAQRRTTEQSYGSSGGNTDEGSDD